MDRPEMADANVPRINKAFSWAVAYWKREKKPILRGLSMDVVGVMAVLMVIFWRPLKLATFDEGFARAIGLPVSAIGLALVIAAAVAAVAAFDAVGSIIVIAMFICPPAAARLLTNALAAQVWISVGIAAGSAVLGYVLAGYGPIWMGFEHSVSAAGMIATVSGLSLALACIWGPHRTRAGGAAGA